MYEFRNKVKKVNGPRSHNGTTPSAGLEINFFWLNYIINVLSQCV
jgi:hypothetical protein